MFFSCTLLRHFIHLASFFLPSRIDLSVVDEHKGLALLAGMCMIVCVFVCVCLCVACVHSVCVCVCVCCKCGEGDSHGCPFLCPPRLLALEAMVLLENVNNTLPLTLGNYKSVALIGPCADDPDCVKGILFPPPPPKVMTSFRLDPSSLIPKVIMTPLQNTL